MSLRELQSVFETFASFGSTRNLSGAATGGESEIDNAKFAKLCRDTKVIDKRVTMTDVDIAFNKVKAKGARKLNFNQFVEALKILAEKRFSERSPSDAFKELVFIVLRNRDPIAFATIPQTDGIYEKLLYDQSTFPTTHKNRINGVEEVEKSLAGVDLSNVVDRQNNGTFIKTTKRNRGNSGSNSALSSTEQLHISNSKKADVRASSDKLSATGTAVNGSKIVVKPSKISGSKDDLSSGSYTARANAGSKSNLTRSTDSLNAKSKSGSVFDRLTDHTKYTGTHQHRFNNDGSGRGIAGRDSVPLGRAPGAYRGGDVKDLSQILRN